MTDVLGAIILGSELRQRLCAAAVGLVLTYRTTGVFNLAFGPRRSSSAAVYYDTHITHHWPMSAGVVLLGRHRRAARRRPPRPRAVPVPPHRERDGQARLGARPVRRDAADDLPVVRAERQVERGRHRARTASITYSPLHNVFVSRDDLAIIVTGVVVFVGLDADVALHRARSAHARGRREPAAHRARRRRTPTASSMVVVDAVERARRPRRRAAHAGVRGPGRTTQRTRRW